MRKDFKMLPMVLKKNICCKLGLGLGFLAFFVLTCFFIKPLAIALAPGAFSVFALVDGIGMTIRCLSGRYIELSGECTEVNESIFRKKLKSFIIETTDGKVKVITKIKTRAIKTGDYVKVYVPLNTSVYDYSGGVAVCEFYGMEIVN